MKSPLLIIFLLLALKSEISGQFHLGTYSFAAVGFGGPITDQIDLEGKLFANRRFSDLALEGSVMFDLKPGTFHQFSVGGGFNFPFYDEDLGFSIVLPVELEIYPLTSFRRLSLLIELAPQFYISDDEFVLRHMWGIRYYFKEPS